VQSAIGADGALAFDLTAACSGFVVGLVNGVHFIRGGEYKNVLVIGADVLSRYVAGAYTRSRSAQLELPLCPTQPNLTHECVPNVLKLSSNVNECKPLLRGLARPRHVHSVRRRLRRHAAHRHRRGRLLPAGRGLHSSNFRLNVSAFWGIRGV